jgi:hypothetical protein
MVIKNKDGSPFRLQRPNPIVKDQDFWEEKYDLHNFKYTDIVTKEGYEHIEKYQQIEEIQPEEVHVKEEKVLKNIEKVMMHCLPAIVKEHYDSLYNEKKTSMSYGNKFTFEAVIVERSGLFFKIWTNTKIERSSILFVPKDRDWWRVESTEPQSGGLIINCIPSETQPSFG